MRISHKGRRVSSPLVVRRRLDIKTIFQIRLDVFSMEMTDPTISIISSFRWYVEFQQSSIKVACNAEHEDNRIDWQFISRISEIW